MDDGNSFASAPGKLVVVEPGALLWERFFTVAPLVLVGTKEPDGSYDLAPKHMATRLGWEPHYGFVCSPRHATYRNAVAHGAFTVSYPAPEQVVQTGLVAGGRTGDGSKRSLAALPTFRARRVDGVLVSGARAFLECELERVVDGFGEASLVAGRVVAAAVDECALRASERDDADLVHAAPLLAYLDPGRLAAVDRSVSFPFPVDFSL